MQREKGNRGESTEKSEQQTGRAAAAPMVSNRAGKAPTFLENKQNWLLRKSISATSNCSRMSNCPNSIKFLFLMNSGEESLVMKPTLSWNNCEHS